MLKDKFMNLQLFADGVDATDQSGNAQTGADINAGNGGDGTTQQKTFTQEELERIIAERLRREREKYKDYNELKKAAEELQKLKEAQMTEQEKLQAKLAEMEKAKMELELKLQEAQLEKMKLHILDELGLPKVWANRIFGTTEEEIRQDAEELKKLLGVSSKPIGGGTNPPTTSGMVNPWKQETLNLTMQAKILKENPALAQRLMAEAGVKP
jgi:hypothetical protein